MQFEPGDLVRVRENTHQDEIPEHRVAVVLNDDEAGETSGDIVLVLFLGTMQPLRFHKMFLEHLNESRR